MDNKSALKRAHQRGAVIVAGIWITFETSQESTLDSICAEIERMGGHIVKITEVQAPPKTGEGQVSYRRIFLVDATLPTGIDLV